jgi:hypothetical protein
MLCVVQISRPDVCFGHRLAVGCESIAMFITVAPWVICFNVAAGTQAYISAKHLEAEQVARAPYNLAGRGT